VLALHRSQLFGRVLVILPVPVETAVAIEARKHKVAWVFGQALGLTGDSASTIWAISNNMCIFAHYALRLGQKVSVNGLTATSEFAASGSSNP
jgi:hypothetical protein